MVMINTVDYGFTANSLPGEAQIYAHTIRGFWAVNRWTGFWTDLEVVDLNLPNDAGKAGVGDVLLGWGAIFREDLSRRFTTAAFIFEALAPTGDPAELTGFGTWILAPSVVFAFNPTDEFPVYVGARYLHSLEGIGGDERGNIVDDDPSRKVRSLELDIQTVHILPKGFFVSAIPTLVLNFNQDFNFFSLGLGGGRAISKSFALSGAYVHHLAGRLTFNQAFTIQLTYLFGQCQDQ